MAHEKDEIICLSDTLNDAIKEKHFDTATAMIEAGVKWNDETWFALKESEPQTEEVEYKRFENLIYAIDTERRKRLPKIAYALMEGSYQMAIKLVSLGLKYPPNFHDLMIQAERRFSPTAEFETFDAFADKMYAVLIESSRKKNTKKRKRVTSLKPKEKEVVEELPSFQKKKKKAPSKPSENEEPDEPVPQRKKKTNPNNNKQ